MNVWCTVTADINWRSLFAKALTAQFFSNLTSSHWKMAEGAGFKTGKFEKKPQKFLFLKKENETKDI